MAVQLASHVYWTNVDGTIFLLDEKRGRYFALDAHYSRLWPSLCKTDGSQDSSDEELTGLYERARKLGWLDLVARTPQRNPSEGCMTQQRRAWRHWLGLRAFGCLLSAHLRLRFRGFHKAHRHACDVQVGCCGGPEPDRQFRDRAIAAFLRAENFFVTGRGFDDCLPRSLALGTFMRRCGFGARHFIGVSKYPFKAHAWVEDEAGIVIDDSRIVAEFAKLTNAGQ